MFALKLSAFGKMLLSVLAVCSLFSLVYVFSLPIRLHLALEMASSKPSIAQLFYNIDRSGFTEANSASVPVSSASVQSFQELSFPLPDKAVAGLRFDPLSTAGSVVIRNVSILNGQSVIYRLPLSTIRPFHQISKTTLGGEELRVETSPGADDPGLLIELKRPLRLNFVSLRMHLKMVAEINGVLLALALLGFAAESRLGAGRAFRGFTIADLNGPVQKLAARLSNRNFITFDSAAVWVYVGAFVLFLIGGALALNGSSEGNYSQYYGRGPKVKTWLGSPRPSRSDEWAYATPDILNQYFRHDRFEVKDSAVGGHDAALTVNIPVRHITTVFRPQFWAFFVLPSDYAYAFYWQGKALLLFAGIFTLLLWIIGSTAWSVTGALWYYFSPFTQWSYSWPSALPEMIGLMCLTVVLVAYVAVGRNTPALMLCAVASAACAVNFALCAYPPHMIPLVWFAGAVLISWCIASRRNIFTRDKAAVRVAAAVLAVGLVAFFGYRIFSDLKTAITAVSQTAYPGHRVYAAGITPIWQMASHFMPWPETEEHFPAVFGNICEGSGFLWLAPLTLFCFPRLVLSRFQKAALAAFWFVFVFVAAWLVLPLPAVFGRLSAMDLTGGSRCLPALGLANVGIVALTMAGLRREPRQRRWVHLPRSRDLAYLTVAFLAFFALLRATNEHTGLFFSTAEVVIASAAAAFLALFLLSNQRGLLAITLVMPQALLSGAVNPIERGLPVFTHSALRQFVSNHRELLQAKWIVFSDTPVSSGFFAAAGCNVYTGLRYVPDIDHFQLFASRGLNVNTFNSLGYLDAHAIAAWEQTQFHSERVGIVTWNVAPSDRILGNLGIRYMAFDAKPSPETSALLRPVSADPVDGFWLYEVP